jgi:uncharacterized protein YggE
MKRAKWLWVGLTLAVVLILGAGCSSEAVETPQGGGSTGGTSNTGSLGNLNSVELADFARSLAPALSQGGGYGQTGIWVTGQGKVTLDPDLALLSLGVETRADTVKAARAQAAEAMTGIIQALKARGIADKDIQTQFYNIQPEYVWNDFAKRQEIIGYRVTNNVTAKVRDLEILGDTIDEVAAAGGDATRIDGIQFTVEDSSVAQNQARERAILDALAKAGQFATLTGVTRGSLLYATESGGGVPLVRDFAKMEFGAVADSAATPISAGELEILVSVQMVFAIGSQ